MLLRLPSDLHLTDDQLYAICRLNRELPIERTAQGELWIMAPAGWDSSRRNAEITLQLGLWAKRDGTGVVVDSSAGYLLPNGAGRAPDASWVSYDRLADRSETGDRIAERTDGRQGVASPHADAEDRRRRARSRRRCAMRRRLPRVRIRAARPIPKLPPATASGSSPRSSARVPNSTERTLPLASEGRATGAHSACAAAVFARSLNRTRVRRCLPVVAQQSDDGDPPEPKENPAC